MTRMVTELEWFRCDECRLSVEGIIPFIIHKAKHGDEIHNFRCNELDYFPTTTTRFVSGKEPSPSASMDLFIPRIEIIPFEISYKNFKCDPPPPSVKIKSTVDGAWVNECLVNGNHPETKEKAADVTGSSIMVLNGELSPPGSTRQGNNAQFFNITTCSLCGHAFRPPDLKSHVLICKSKVEENVWKIINKVQRRAHMDESPYIQKFPSSSFVSMKRCLNCKKFIKSGESKAHSAYNCIAKVVQFVDKGDRKIKKTSVSPSGATQRTPSNNPEFQDSNPSSKCPPPKPKTSPTVVSKPQKNPREVTCPCCGCLVKARHKVSRPHFNHCFRNPPFKCEFPLCSLQFLKSASLVTHFMISHMEMKMVQCTDCLKFLSTKFHLKRHVKNGCRGPDGVHQKRRQSTGNKVKKRSPPNRSYMEVRSKCPRCDSVFRDQDLHRHLKKCYEAPPFQCTFQTCATVLFGGYKPLVSHIMRSHTKMVECPNCGNFYNQKHDMMKHLEMYCRNSTFNNGKELKTEICEVEISEEALPTLSTVLVPPTSKGERRRNKQRVVRKNGRGKCDTCGVVMKSRRLFYHRKLCKKEYEASSSGSKALVGTAASSELPPAELIDGVRREEANAEKRKTLVQPGVVVKLEEEFHADLGIEHAADQNRRFGESEMNYDSFSNLFYLETN